MSVHHGVVPLMLTNTITTGSGVECSVASQNLYFGSHTLSVLYQLTQHKYCVILTAQLLEKDMPEVTESSFTERELITVSTTVGDNSITMTQDYSEYFDSGHYKYAIFDKDGNIIGANSSMAGAPKGKLIVGDAISMLERFLEEAARFG